MELELRWVIHNIYIYDEPLHTKANIQTMMGTTFPTVNSSYLLPASLNKASDVIRSVSKLAFLIFKLWWN